jgi:hypothetical protein
MNASVAEEEIVRQATARALALVRRDAGAMEALLSSDFVYTNSSGIVMGKREYIEAYVLAPSVSWKRQNLTAEHVTIVGDTAIVVGRVRDEARFGDFTLDAEFRTTQVYRRTDGSWRYLAGHTSSPTQ